MMAEEGDGGGPAKRRRAFTRRETLEKLEELEGNVAAVVGEIDFGLWLNFTHIFHLGAMVSDLTPFDENVIDYEVRIEKLASVNNSLQNKIYRLKKDVKDRKFKHKPDLLDEDMISCSQFSVLQSSQEEEEEEPLSTKNL